MVGDASGPVPGEMWENQLAGTGHFSPTNRKIVQLSILGFPKSDPSLEVISLDHGLEAPCHETRDYGHLVLQRGLNVNPCVFKRLFFPFSVNLV